jgi:hypothetical protein
MYRLTLNSNLYAIRIIINMTSMFQNFKKEPQKVYVELIQCKSHTWPLHISNAHKHKHKEEEKQKEER